MKRPLTIRDNYPSHSNISSGTIIHLFILCSEMATRFDLGFLFWFQLFLFSPLFPVPTQTLLTGMRQLWERQPSIKHLLLQYFILNNRTHLSLWRSQEYSKAFKVYCHNKEIQIPDFGILTL